jgi:spore coat polysaccharide biosynthesis protein SpsF (cytidylyltransferase family)
MSSVTLDERRIKDLFKQAVLELFQERRDLLYDLFAEVIEDLALANAIKEGESTETVSRAEVFRILEGAN